MEGSSRSESAGRSYLTIPGRGAEPDRMWFAAIAVFASVRILVLLAAAAANQARKAPLSVTPLARAAVREK
jgi:hypothetical protein